MINCPLKSASAVYKARGMYGIVEPFTRFDNYSICDSQGIYYRLAQADSLPLERTEIEERMLAFPSPNAGPIQIRIISNSESDYHLSIINLTGQVLFSKNHVSSTYSMNLTELSLASGHYIVSMEQNSTGNTFRSRVFYEK